MNSLYLQQTRSLFTSFITILILVISLFIIARSAAFLSFTLESGLSAFTFLKYILFQVPVQVSTLLPLCFFAACITTFNAISSSGEHLILRAAGTSQISLFTPAHVTGFLLFLMYIPFLFEVLPWATRNIQDIEQKSRELLAQNTLINAGEATFIGAAEVFVQETQGTDLSHISLFAKDAKGQEVFLHGKTANFTLGSNGIALALSDGRVLQSHDHTPTAIQRFQNVLIDLAPLIQNEDAARPHTSTLGLSVFDLFRRAGKSQSTIIDHQKEGGRRLAYLCLIMVMPSWILFWQLLSPQARGGGSRIALLGPISMLPVLIFLQSPGIYAGKSLGTLAATLGLILLLGLVGPAYYMVLGWRLSRKVIPT